MKTRIDIDQWVRKEHYLFFSEFEEPLFGVTVKIDCTKAYSRAKEEGVPFFLYYLYRALKAANQIPYFRYRIIEKEVYKFDVINASTTISRPNGTFGFGHIDYFEDEALFYERALQEIENVKKTTSLIPSGSVHNTMHFSAVPWIDFTSMSHARKFSHPESCPKVSFGKLIDVQGNKEMSLSVHVHHALMDGYHLGLFIEKFQNFLNEV